MVRYKHCSRVAEGGGHSLLYTEPCHHLVSSSYRRRARGACMARPIIFSKYGVPYIGRVHKGSISLHRPSSGWKREVGPWMTPWLYRVPYRRLQNARHIGVFVGHRSEDQLDPPSLIPCLLPCRARLMVGDQYLRNDGVCCGQQYLNIIE